MAELLWGHVNLNAAYAGVLRQEPGQRCSFTYDPSYLAARHPPIAWTLPLQEMPHLCGKGLHPFFDNLVAEGWLEEAQTRLLGKRHASRFELLLAFGEDCAGAVSVHDPTPAKLDQKRIDRNDPREIFLLKGRASLSGVQPKLTLVKEDGKYLPAKKGQTSTHIAKFSSANHVDIVFTEYLTTQAFAALLPGDSVVSLDIDTIAGSTEPALIIERFDRTPTGSRIHFEEFNQLLDRSPEEKYDGSHKEMADFIGTTPGCLPTEVYRLYLRILAGLLLGNTDMHFKNFAMFHAPEGLRLTPSYDQVAAVLYGFNTIALAIGGAEDISWPHLKARSLVRLGEEFGLSTAAMHMGIEQLARRKNVMLDTIRAGKYGETAMKDDLIKRVKKRWNGTFNLIGRALSKKR